MAILRLQNLRWVTVILGIANAFVFLLGGLLFFVAYSSCERHLVIAVAVMSVVAGLRIAAMVQSAIAQEATARTVLLESNADGTTVLGSVLRNERRTRYKKWLWWTRLTVVVTVFQFVGAIYLVFCIANHVSNGGKTSHCAIGSEPNSNDWKLHLLVLFMIITCIIALLQCCTRSDVLRWRSYYATKDDAWKAHYSEVFDHHIREALCCLGRVKYLNVLEEDEVFSVAQLLGDLVAYRASGTGHLELLADYLMRTRRELG